MLTAKPLDVLSHIRHGFFTREGGVSKGIYASLNCGYGSNDDKAAVRENRARAALKLSVEAEKLLTVHQTHSPDVIEVTDPWTPESAPHADAMVTTTPGIALGILAADCAPVLFADTRANVIGAAHAGWKGAFTGVLEATIDAMIGLGAKRNTIAAAIGPCISKDAYEVGPEFRGRFLDADGDNDKWFHPSDKRDHFLFDLPGYVEARLEAADIGTLAILGHCTFQESRRFFSYRRATHRREPDYGRHISALMLRG
ncbi:MAG: peptidoglycan editing factor PgeF [Alphaproteobacteria bacterium HGW-Alphaproteobacteria-12]|nr:MAG: peptidoglycan editing factor PgeF [Alphaproteobacteria bacterium HGW-Alphaproteobacteria-12]